MKPSHRAQKTAFFGVIVFALLAGSGLAQNKHFGLISVENKTNALAFISIEDKGMIPEAKERGLGEFSLYDVVLRNNYDKPITVYYLTGRDEKTGENILMEPHGTFLTKSVFKPGETIKTNFVMRFGGKAQLTAEAVIFEDGTGDGNAESVTFLQEQCKGVSLAYEQFIPVVREVLKNEDLLTDTWIGELLKKIDSMRPDKVSTSVMRGFNMAKANLGICLRATEYFMNNGTARKAWESLTDKLSEMEAGVKRFTRTSDAKEVTISSRDHR